MAGATDDPRSALALAAITGDDQTLGRLLAASPPTGERADGEKGTEIGKLQTDGRARIGCTVGDRDASGRTPLMLAARWGHCRTVCMLIDSYGADVSKRDFRGMTALMHGARGSHEDVVNILLKYGANIDGIDQNGESALLHAVRRGNHSFVKFLVSEAKASLTLKLSEGKNILEHAQRWRASGTFKQIYEHLLSQRLHTVLSLDLASIKMLHPQILDAIVGSN